MSADSYDSPWKEMLDLYFPDFLAFFFPHAYEDVDWARGWESLDQELHKLIRDGEAGKRLADKLIRVQRLDGQEGLVLVHVEVQGEHDVELPERMFVSNYRIYDRYRRPVVSLAVLGDGSASWRPDEFGWEIWECAMGIRFPAVKLHGYNEDWAALEKSLNPFSTVVMAHLQTRATRQDPESRYAWKFRLVRRLYESGYPRRDIVALFRFIDWVMRLPEELDQELAEDLRELEEEHGMPYVTYIERKGIEQGIQQGEAAILRRLMMRRYPSFPAWAEERLAKAGTADLERWSERIFDAERIEDVFDD